MESGTSERRPVAGVHRRDRKAPQPFEARQIVTDIRLRKFIEEQAVIDDVAAEEHARGGFEERDRARRVPGKVQDSEFRISEMKTLAASEPPRLRHRAEPVEFRLEPHRASVDEELRQLLADSELLTKFVPADGVADGSGNGLVRVHSDVIELVRRAHMVKMCMGDHEDRIVEKEFRLFSAERRDPEPRIYDEITGRAANVPNIRAKKLVYVRFNGSRNPIVDLLALEPGRNDGKGVGHRVPILLIVR